MPTTTRLKIGAETTFVFPFEMKDKTTISIKVKAANEKEAREKVGSYAEEMLDQLELLDKIEAEKTKPAAAPAAPTAPQSS